MCDKVKVAVRVRPLNRREQSLGTKCVVEMRNGQTILYKSSPTDHQQPKSFAFDHCFWSFDVEDAHFASQKEVYHDIGTALLDNAVEGYNACIFAYGQTGSGKSYTMMGSKEDKGLIPRLCDDLFERIARHADPNTSFKVEVSYMEIYNEKVHDLLDASGCKQQLRVREHNIMGTYVENLSKHAVTSYDQINELMAQGNKSRTVAATNMNSESSRSHAVFNITLTCTINDPVTNSQGEKMSKMSLVDLAGSERATKTGAVGDRLKEGSNINKSLTTLGMVISKLAEGKTSSQFIPYRDSVLTWLLKDKLGGNSKTVMVATISPAADNYEETLSTLRYADRAKRIVNHAVVNEDPNAKLIRQLKQQVEELKARLLQVRSADVSARLEESESLMKEISQPWEEKVKHTEQVHIQRQQALEKMGISVEADGIKVESDKFYLVNLNADPSLNEMLLFNIKKERTLVGRPDSERPEVQPDIHLFGIGIQNEHCVLIIENGEELWIEPREGARTCVNGVVVSEKRLLKNGDRIFWGNHHFFRVTCPQKQQQQQQLSPEQVAQKAAEPPIDYQFAREELMLQELSNDPIQTAIATLERQHEEDKNMALEKQRQMYEKQLQILREQMSPTTPYAPYVGLERAAQESWARERDHLFKVSLAKLREQTATANDLVREANLLSEQLNKNTTFRVTLQIPTANLTPNRKKSAFVSEPAILVSRPGMSSQIWSMDKLENKLIDMRELFAESGASLPPHPELRTDLDPFFESQENHSLIGVANMFLGAVFHDVKLAYQVPIISQHGEVAGRLHMEICRTQGSLDRVADCGGTSGPFNGQGSVASAGSAHMSTSMSAGQLGVALAAPGSSQASAMDTSTTSVTSTGSSGSGEVASVMSASQRFVRIRVTIKEATGLPSALCNFVFCQYSFWGNNVTVAPQDVPDPAGASVPPNHAILVTAPNGAPARLVAGGQHGQHGHHGGSTIVRFDHTKEFDLAVTEDFVEYCLEGALSVEVFGHTSSGFSSHHKQLESEESSNRQQIVCSEGESCPLDHSVMTRSEILSTGEDPLTSAMMSGNPRLALIDSPPSSPSPPQNADGSDSTITNDNPYRDAIPHNKHDSTYHAGEADEMPGRRPPSPIFRASCGVSPNGAFGAIFLNPLRALFQALVHGPALWFMNQNSHEATTKRPHDRRSLDEAVKFISKHNGHTGINDGFRTGMDLGPESLGEVHLGEHSLAARWSELKRKLELWLEIHELNEQGEYAPVEVTPRPDAATGGVFQLRQGQQRRMVVSVSAAPYSGTLPLSCEAITHVSVGGLCARKVGLQKPLDSYQDDDLRALRDKWVAVLDKRKHYLHEQLVKMSAKENKSEQETERERQLLDAWMRLQEERDAVYTPQAGSRVPGAPAEGDGAELAGMELHTPVLFLDLSSDDMNLHPSHIPGANSILSKELGSPQYTLPIVRSEDNRVVVAWDSSIHDSPLLNAATSSQDRIYLILKAKVRLSHPVSVDIILRKRFAINVYKRQTFTEKLRKRISGAPTLYRSGVTYEIVGSIPKACEDLEGRETLALMAAQGLDDVAADGESYIEKYTKVVISVESILNLDKLRQDVAVKELLHSQGRPIRKTLSVPNMAQSMSSSMTSSMIKQSIMSLSMYDESTSGHNHGATGMASAAAAATITHSQSAAVHNGHNGSLSHNSSYGDGLDKLKDAASAITGAARPTFLNLNFNLNLRQSSLKHSPATGALVGQKLKPLRPLIEENLESISILSHPEEEDAEELFRRSHNTSDSTEPKSLVSSGYGSQALSTEDSPTR
ncbi:kinesin-like protein KIF13A isoform X2 [Varroa jacobsoni]|uniref:Kinesin motor domain-containing protein n=1 Tax=Varroa destructor TaxID=109461 RepID=A0A7M7JKV5_VARDE|nr:kinesin-like protein KIF13A isoform X2 [Varroa destructor]XP_022689047.1 kinesin-like protein KIF13A isoform X2 [Varroa jacobsoni]